MELWVVNASPLISLGKAGYLDIFLRLPEKIVVPREVVQEITAGPDGDPAKYYLKNEKIAVVESSASAEILAWDLGKGETSVLSYALSNPGWTAILDDLVARKCAKSYAVPTRGTLAVMILARRKGMIPSAKEGLLALRNAGMRLDDEIIRIALKRELGEDW